MHTITRSIHVRDAARRRPPSNPSSIARLKGHDLFKPVQLELVDDIRSKYSEWGHIQQSLELFSTDLFFLQVKVEKARV